MASITERKRKDGSSAFMAQIMIKREGVILHRENKTFDTRRKAAAWAARREDELDQPDALSPPNDPTLADVIEKYTSDTRKEIGRTKAQVLRAIKATDLGRMRCSRIASKDVITFANKLAGTMQPQTVANYLSHLGAVFAIARPAWGFPLDQQAMRDAFVVAKRLGVTGKSHQRDRRPTVDEIGKLADHFDKVRSRRVDSVPMRDVMMFALFSTRRQEEITRIVWADFDEGGKRVMVRDMKHPGDKLGNDQWVDLPPEAIAIIKRQPRTKAEIFPYSTDAIGAAFTRACKVLAISDLHFHDLRHEGVSRLFEMGWNIPHVASVSGHRSWSSLKRYTHMRQTGDKWAGYGAGDATGNDRHPMDAASHLVPYDSADSKS